MGGWQRENQCLRATILQGSKASQANADGRAAWRCFQDEAGWFGGDLLQLALEGLFLAFPASNDQLGDAPQGPESQDRFLQQ
jgi:hypothetical protein